ncbi:glycosyltransferase [Streptomyces sp. NPDC004546]|uniref:glycosyltransferase family 2 protein n=1 Tax=unclassified Streptomyces TaxID=2593676 RepID=UPI00339EE762
MHNVLIAVPTLGTRRLSSLLAELKRHCELVRPSGYAAEVLLLDNSPDGCPTAVRAAAEYEASYVRVPEPGYSRVRNAALDAAERHDALVFIDDDELPTDGWLAALLRGTERYGADVVTGPVRAVVPDGAPRWLGDGAALRPLVKLPDGPLDGPVATNNTLLRMDTVRKSGLRFDAAFDRTGGEDTVFFASLGDRGAKMAFLGTAVVVEIQDPDRLRLRTFVRRACLNGQRCAMVEHALHGRATARHLLRRTLRPFRGLARIAAALPLRRPLFLALGLEDLAFSYGWWRAVTARHRRRLQGTVLLRHLYECLVNRAVARMAKFAPGAHSGRECCRKADICRPRQSSHSAIDCR